MKIEILKLTRGFTLRIDTASKVEHVAVRDLPGLYVELGDYLAPPVEAGDFIHTDPIVPHEEFKPVEAGDFIHTDPIVPHEEFKPEDKHVPLDPAPMPMHGDKPFSVGDCVHSIEYGNGKVTDIDQSAIMPIEVTFNAYDTVRYFYPNGCFAANSPGDSSFDLKHGDKPWES